MKDRSKNFNCSNNGLTTLKICPDTVEGDFNCGCNHLTTLKGCPKVINGTVYCYFNTELEDISDLPPMIRCIAIEDCPNIKVFTKEITNDNGELIFYSPTDEVRNRIKSWSYYDIVEEYNFSISVRIKPDNEQYMNEL